MVIKDELTIFIRLKDVKLILSEWIPFGHNHIILFNEQVDSVKNVKGSLLTDMIDKSPETPTFITPPVLTKVDVINFDFDEFVNFKASIKYPEVVKQEEEFAVHVDSSGRVIYGVEMVKVGGEEEFFSLDRLSRIIFDIVDDSSRMMNTLLSNFQRRLLNLTYYGSANVRNKFVFMVASDISPRKNRAEEYLDGEELQNEINQIIECVYKVKNFKNGGMAFLGTNGTIIVSENASEYDEILYVASYLFGFDLFQRNLFSRLQMLYDANQDTRRLILQASKFDPRAIDKTQNSLSEISANVVLMNEIISYMHNSVATIKREWDEVRLKMSEAQRELSEFFDIENLFSTAEDRIKDVELIVNGLQDEIRGLQGLATAISERQMRKIYETLQENTRSMDEMIRESQKTSKAVNVLQWIIAGSVAFKIVTLLSGQSPYSYLDPIMLLLGLPSASQLSPYTILTIFSYGVIIWAGITLVLYFIAKYVGSRSIKSVRLRVRLNAPFNEDKLVKYISSKPLFKHDDHFDYDQQLYKKSWIDRDEKWKGRYPTITLIYDRNNNILSQIQVEVDKPKLKANAYVNLIMEELINAEVLDKEAKKSIRID
jgi:WD repeat-containing protein 35